MGISSNLLYLLLLYAVLDKEGKLSTTTGLLIAIGIMVTTGCFSGLNPCNRLVQTTGLNNFAFSNALA